MGRQIPLERFQIAEDALRSDEQQLRQRGVVDEYQQHAGRSAVLEPAMIGTVDLDQFAEGFPRAGVVDGNVRRFLRDTQRPASVIHLRGISRETLRS